MRNKLDTRPKIEVKNKLPVLYTNSLIWFEGNWKLKHSETLSFWSFPSYFESLQFERNVKILLSDRLTLVKTLNLKHRCKYIYMYTFVSM